MININLHKKCKHCGSLFPAKVRSLEILCNKPECQEWKKIYTNRIKKSRSVSMDYFDIYDLDRPSTHCYVGYERVCRYCGKPVLKKDGKYSAHMRYCQEHRGKGYELFESFNWQATSKAYAFHIQDQFKNEIQDLIKGLDFKMKKNPYEKDHFVICEECHKICLIFDYYIPRYKNIEVINVHHKKPVHTLEWDDLYLIWDFSNLSCLCQECHNKQDHHLKKKETIKEKYNIGCIEEWF